MQQHLDMPDRRQLLCGLALPDPVRAQDIVDLDTPLVASTTPIADASTIEAANLAAADPQEARPVAIEYSEGHGTRAKIHKYASWATLPLMAMEFALGQQLYNDPNSINSSSRGGDGARPQPQRSDQLRRQQVDAPDRGTRLHRRRHRRVSPHAADRWQSLTDDPVSAS
jgi:hypothetical protein